MADERKQLKIPSFLSVLSLDVDSFMTDNLIEMWYLIFVWFLISSFLVHSIAALVGVWALRRHKVARFYPIMIIVMGIVGPITGGIITSFLIAGLFKVTQIVFYPLWALVIGWGQTFVVVFVSFSRFLATL